jgi:hypothetical protein
LLRIYQGDVLVTLPLQARDGVAGSFSSSSGPVGPANFGGTGGGGAVGDIPADLSRAFSTPSWVAGMGGSSSLRAGNVRNTPFGPDWSRPKSPARVIDGAGRSVPEVLVPRILNSFYHLIWLLYMTPPQCLTCSICPRESRCTLMMHLLAA